MITSFVYFRINTISDIQKKISYFVLYEIGYIRKCTKIYDTNGNTTSYSILNYRVSRFILPLYQSILPPYPCIHISMSALNFQLCLGELKEICSSELIFDPVMILDNPRIHQARISIWTGFSVLHLPQYCSFLNPIENCFLEPKI